MSNLGTESSIFSGAEIDDIKEKGDRRVNQYYQDSSFKLLFSEDKYRRLFLKENCKGVDYANAEIEDVALQDVFINDIHNDVCFRADNTLIVLLEHQSCINNNMPLRLLMYVAEEYKRMFKNSNRWKELFAEDRCMIPRPEFYVIYTGTKEWNVRELRLSDAFCQGETFLELKVPVFTKDNSHGIIEEYTNFIGTIKDLRGSGMRLESAIAQAVNEFESSDYEIADFLRNKEDIMETLNRCLTQEEIMNAQIEGATKKAVNEAVKEAVKDTLRQNIKDSYDMLITGGLSVSEAIDIIANKKNISPEEVRIILRS